MPRHQASSEPVATRLSEVAHIAGPRRPRGFERERVEAGDAQRTTNRPEAGHPDADAGVEATEATALVEHGGLEELEAVVPVAPAKALAATGQHARAPVVARRARSRLLERAERLTDPAMRARFLELPHHARCMGFCVTGGGAARAACERAYFVS